MKEDKQADSRTIAGLRGQADGLNLVLLETYFIRRPASWLTANGLAQTQDRLDA